MLFLVPGFDFDAPLVVLVTKRGIGMGVVGNVL